MLRRAASLVALLLLLITAAPVMACVTGQQMSHRDDACCQMMHGKCGDMAKTGCCRVEVRDQQPQVATHAWAVSLHWVATAAVDCAVVMPQTETAARWMAPDEHSPPFPRSARPTVLRL